MEYRPSTPISPMLKFAQLNMRRSQQVTLETCKVMETQNIDILLMQEPYNPKGKFIGFGSGALVVSGAEIGTSAMASIYVRNRNITVHKMSHLSNSHCTCIEVNGPFGKLYLASMYFQHSHAIDPYIAQLRKIVALLPRAKLIIGADANAKSPLWFSEILDDRDEALAEATTDLNLLVLNEPGNPPTFQSHNGISRIDVTLASMQVISSTRSWRVREGLTTSDHNMITFSTFSVPTSQYIQQQPRFNSKKANWDKFLNTLAEEKLNRLSNLRLTTAENVEAAAVAIHSAIVCACEASVKRKTPHSRSVPWWTENLTTIKKMSYKARKAFQAERDPERRETKKRIYARIRRDYTSEVYRAKKVDWQKLVSDKGNSSPWGVVYKLRMQKILPERALASSPLEAGRSITWEHTALKLLNSLVPDDTVDSLDIQRNIRAARDIHPDTPEAEEFNELEVRSAVSRLRNGKAPGSDGIEVEILKASYQVLHEELLAVYNSCLSLGEFPKIWKSGSIRALLKGPHKDESAPSSYRPICLLPVLGKCLEKLLVQVLQPTFDDARFASCRQFGFKKGKSTEDAILKVKELAAQNQGHSYTMAVLFDIAGAFDNVWWPSILHRLKERQCPKNVYGVIADYLRGREVQLIGKHGFVRKSVSRGCPQGSILGPHLWNLIFDDLLSTLARAGHETVAYADDLIILVHASSRRELEARGQHAATLVERWCQGEKLTVSASKSEMILLNGKLDTKRPPTIRVQGKSIKMTDTVKYLGAHIDKGFGVKSHALQIKAKCQQKFNSLAIVARREWGLKFRCLMTLYTGLFVPIATYAAAAWSDKLNKTSTNELLRAQRYALLCVTKAYRSTPTVALPVIAGVLPIDLKIKQMALRYKIRRQQAFDIDGYQYPRDAGTLNPEEAIDSALFREWQVRWDSSEKGRHTFAIFPDVKSRLKGTWLYLTHYNCQFISGHGDFAMKLHSMNLADNPLCSCPDTTTGTSPLQTPHHVLFDCALYEHERAPLRNRARDIGLQWPPTLSRLTQEDLFSEFSRTSRDILRAKDLAQATRQQ